MLAREVRIVDTSIVAGLQNGTAFFASTSLLAIGAAFALLTTSDQVLQVMQELPLGPNTQRAVWEVKALGLLAIYALNAGLQFVVTYWGHMLGINIETDMRRALFSHLQKLSFRFYDNNKTGHLVSRMSTDLFDIGEVAHHVVGGARLGPADGAVAGVEDRGGVRRALRQDDRAGPVAPLGDGMQWVVGHRFRPLVLAAAP